MTVSTSHDLMTYDGVPIRRLPPGEPKTERTRHVVVGWRKKDSHIALRLWWPLNSPETQQELRRLGFRRRAKSTWTGPKTTSSLEFCRTLRPSGIVRSIETYCVENKKTQ